MTTVKYQKNRMIQENAEAEITKMSVEAEKGRIFFCEPSGKTVLRVDQFETTADRSKWGSIVCEGRLSLSVDLKTGKVTNWPKNVTDKDIQELLDYHLYYV